MKVYLVQHGEALPKDVDPDRPLSARGAEDVSRLAAFLSAHGVTPARIIHSGKTRARQTADILATSLTPGSAPQQRKGLGPIDPIEPLVRELRQSDSETLLVGHMPFVGRVADELIAEECIPDVTKFRPGTAVCLQRTQEGPWSVSWMLPPELLAAD